MAFAIVSMCASAQIVKKSFYNLTHCQFNFDFGAENKSMQPYYVDIELGAKLPGFCVYALAAADDLHLTDTKQYLGTSVLLGGGVRKNLLTIFPGIQLSARASIAASVGNADWNHSVYKVGIGFNAKARTTPSLYFGYQHNSSHTAGIPNYNGMFCSIGLQLW